MNKHKFLDLLKLIIVTLILMILSLPAGILDIITSVVDNIYDKLIDIKYEIKYKKKQIIN